MHKDNVCGCSLVVTSTGPGEFMIFVILCPGIGSSSDFKASQKTGPRLKDSSNIRQTERAGNRTRDSWVQGE